MGALDGLIVADFSRVLAGPLATMTLGDLGADVIKVEKPGTGDDTRTWGPPWAQGTSTYFLSVNRNKRSIALDLHDPADAALALSLCCRADVVVDNFMPGTMAKFGLDHDTLAALNPSVITCSITGFGSAGDGAVMPGYDLLLQAESGLMSITGDADGQPLKTGVAIVDVIAGLQASTAILAALRARDRDGMGQHVEVSLLSAALAALVNQGSAFLNADVTPQRHGNRHPSIAPYEIYATADSAIAIACGSEAMWQRLCAALDAPSLAADERFATNTVRVANADALAAEIEQRLRTDTTEHWTAVLAQHTVPAGPVNDISAAHSFAAAVGQDPGITATDGSRSARSPLDLSATPVSYRLPPPGIDQHGDDIRRWLASR